MAEPLRRNDIMETSLTAGVGTLTLQGAVTGHRPFSDIGNGNSCVARAYEVDANGVPTGLSETFVGTYAAAGANLSRDRVLWNNSGTNASVNFNAGVTKRVINVLTFDELESPQDMAEGRLTLTSGVPVTTADVTAAATIYYTPYKGNRIRLWDGSRWVTMRFAETSLSLSGYIAGYPYDIFAYDNAGIVWLVQVGWTNNSARTVTLARNDGVLTRSDLPTHRYLGTIYTSGAGITEDSAKNRFLYNHYNRVQRHLSTGAITDNHPGTGLGTWAEWHGGTNSTRLQWLAGLVEDTALATFHVGLLGDTAHYIFYNLGLNTVAAPNGGHAGGCIASYAGAATYYNGGQKVLPVLGLNFLAPMEFSNSTAVVYNNYQNDLAIWA